MLVLFFSNASESFAIKYSQRAAWVLISEIAIIASMKPSPRFNNAHAFLKYVQYWSAVFAEWSV